MANWCKTCGTDCTGSQCDDCRREQMRDRNTDQPADNVEVLDDYG